MKMPGFTAEASLSNERTRRRSVGQRVDHSRGGNVIPSIYYPPPTCRDKTACVNHQKTRCCTLFSGFSFCYNVSC